MSQNYKSGHLVMSSDHSDSSMERILYGTSVNIQFCLVTLLGDITQQIKVIQHITSVNTTQLHNHTTTTARLFALQNGRCINSRDYKITQIMTCPLPKLVYIQWYKSKITSTSNYYFLFVKWYSIFINN